MIKDGLKDKTENADYQVRGWTATADMSLPPNSHHVWLHNKSFPLLAWGLKSNNMDSGSSALVSTHINKQHNKKLHGQHVVLLSDCAKHTGLDPFPASTVHPRPSTSPLPAATTSTFSHITHLLICTSSFVSFWLRWTHIKPVAQLRIGPHFWRGFFSPFSLSLSRYFSSFLQMWGSFWLTGGSGQSNKQVIRISVCCWWAGCWSHHRHQVWHLTAWMVSGF